MDNVPDWLKLWKQLVKIQTRVFDRKQKSKDSDLWKNKARHFDDMVREKWAYPDSSRQFIQSVLETHPGSTLLDIGAGTGAWSLYFAPYAKQITAVEPSDAMGEILLEHMVEENTANIRLIKGNWLDIEIHPHDFVLASHSMYGESEFSEFILKMSETARKTCFLVLRVPFTDALMAKAALHIWGQPYDSPNFQIAFNALLQMGIYPNVLMETGKPWKPWSHDSMEEAFSALKNRLDVNNSTEHDEFLKRLLDEHLTERDGKVYWPVGTCSALVYWHVS